MRQTEREPAGAETMAVPDRKREGASCELDLKALTPEGHAIEPPAHANIQSVKSPPDCGHVRITSDQRAIDHFVIHHRRMSVEPKLIGSREANLVLAPTNAGGQNVLHGCAKWPFGPTFVQLYARGQPERKLDKTIIKERQARLDTKPHGILVFKPQQHWQVSFGDFEHLHRLCVPGLVREAAQGFG